MISRTPVLFEALSATPVLAGLNAEALKLLADEGVVHDFEADEIVVREGDPGHSFFILVEGSVDVVKDLESSHAVKLAKFSGRNFFGEMCVVDPVPRAATVYATAKVKAIEIKSSTLHHLFQRMPDQYAIVLLNISRDMARRLRTLDTAFAAFAACAASAA